MNRKFVFQRFFQVLTLSLLLVSGISSAASRDFQSGRLHLISLPGTATATVGSLFGDELTAETLNRKWAVYAYNTDTSRYRRLLKDDSIGTSEAFWLVQYTGRTITIDLEEAVEKAALKRSAACTAGIGCYERELTATGRASWVFIGAPFTDNLPISSLRLVTNSGACVEGCSIDEAKAARLTSGYFYTYDSATRRYVSKKEGDLDSQTGYMFTTRLPADSEGATLLIPSQEEPEPEPEANATLLFSSGFGSVEERVELTERGNDPEDNEGYRRIKGIDAITGFSWDTILNAEYYGYNATYEELSQSDGLWGSSNCGIHQVHDEYIDNELVVVNGHKENGDDSTEQTVALYQESLLRSPNGKTPQTPFQIDNILRDPDEYYISYWMKIDDTSMKGDDDYRIIWQFKSDHFDYQNESEPGFRISIFMKNNGDGVYWSTEGDDQKRTRPEHWQITDKVTPVPRQKWFKVEIYHKVSSGNDGKFWAKINGAEIASHDGQNLGSSEDSMDFMMLWQLYSNSFPAHQWVDDVQIWDGYPYAD